MPQIQFSQRDPRWANLALGTSNVTIGVAGCYVTTDANIAQHFGHDVTPASLNDALIAQGLYVNGNLCSDKTLEQAFPDIKLIETRNYPGDADLSWLVNTWEDEYVIEVDGQPATPGLQTHFTRFWSYENGVLLILDPWTGTVVDVAKVYGDPVKSVYSISHYRGPAQVVPAAPEPAVAPIIPAAPTPAPVPHDPVTAPTLPTEPIVEAPTTPVEAPQIATDTSPKEVTPMTFDWNNLPKSVKVLPWLVASAVVTALAGWLTPDVLTFIPADLRVTVANLALIILKDLIDYLKAQQS